MIMKTTKMIALQILVCCIVIATWKALESDTRRRWEQAYDSADNAVVEVATLTTIGTGFIFRYSRQSLIVTNEHVIEGASNIKIHFQDSIVADADIVDASSTNDIAVLRPRGVDLTRYAQLTEGTSHNLQIGDELMTIGYPLGESHHLSIGLYAGREKRQEIGHLLRLNMPVDPGNSGGPLIDDEGRVVGIVTLKDSRSSSISFAIPIEQIRLLKLP
jgi:S1-C subfamily serine protease